MLHLFNLFIKLLSLSPQNKQTIKQTKLCSELDQTNSPVNHLQTSPTTLTNQFSEVEREHSQFLLGNSRRRLEKSRNPGTILTNPEFLKNSRNVGYADFEGGL